MREERYWIELDGEPRQFRGVELCGVAFLARVYPDMGYWRSLFPLGRGHGIDTRSAMTYFIRECVKAGVYDPGKSESGGSSGA